MKQVVIGVTVIVLAALILEYVRGGRSTATTPDLTSDSQFAPGNGEVWI